MFRARSRSAFQICLVIAGVALLMATAVGVAASAHSCRAASCSRSQGWGYERAARPLARQSSHRKSPASRSKKCVAHVARAYVTKQRKTRKSCAHRRKSCAHKKSKKQTKRAKKQAKRVICRKKRPPGGSQGSGGSTSGSGGSSPVSETPVEEPSGPGEPFRFFSPTSFWNEALPANAPLAPSSAAVIHAFDGEVATEELAKKGPNINTASWSVPIYTVGPSQPTVRVALEASSTSLQAAWDAVPLPADARPAGGTDKHLVVWQPSTDQLWEFYELEHGTSGWHAGWGGAVQHESTNAGAYSSEAWPGATSTWGASASSLSIAGGLITLEDLERGRINHALAMAVYFVRAGVYASPAARSDGGSPALTSLPEGAHLRLEPNLNLAALHLPRLTLMMAEAAQHYGIFVNDHASNVAFVAQDPTPTGTEPYAGLGGYFEGKSPRELLASFPWAHLQLLKMQLHSTS
jgi:hypothetical protein